MQEQTCGDLNNSYGNIYTQAQTFLEKEVDDDIKA